jgi:hypothetical protein
MKAGVYPTVCSQDVFLRVFALRSGLRRVLDAEDSSNAGQRTAQSGLVIEIARSEFNSGAL